MEKSPRRRGKMLNSAVVRHPNRGTEDRLNQFYILHLQRWQTTFCCTSSPAGRGRTSQSRTKHVPRTAVNEVVHESAESEILARTRGSTLHSKHHEIAHHQQHLFPIRPPLTTPAVCTGEYGPIHSIRPIDVF
jgi:hypothetical protein